MRERESESERERERKKLTTNPPHCLAFILEEMLGWREREKEIENNDA